MRSSCYLVAGLGKTGYSIARYLRRRNKPFVMFDTRLQPSGLAEFNAEFPGVDVFLGEVPDTLYSQLIAIITSPGVAQDHVFMQKAVSLEIPVYGDIECLAREVQAPIIAITGTNGKSTVTTLVGEMAALAGLSVAVAGNIGSPVLDLWDDPIHYDLWVLELSSFQLDLTHTLAPIAATVLNITPDHLDRHHSLKAYTAAKQRVYHQAQSRVYNRDDTQTYPESIAVGDRLVSYGLNSSTGSDWGIVMEGGVAYLAQGEIPLMPVDALRIKGRHNWSNAIAACALAHEAGIAKRHMIAVLEQFSGLPHRTQWIRTLDGVDWINDSKGTNVGATVSAISGIGGSMQGKIVLIAGGQGKGADFTQLRHPMAECVRSVVLMGEDAQTIADSLAGIVPISHATSLEDAVNQARAAAHHGDVVLLSPACASFDMFRDFNHRGEAFANVVEAL